MVKLILHSLDFGHEIQPVFAFKIPTHSRYLC